MIIFQFKLNDSWCYVDKENGVYITTGQVGNNTYNSLVEVLKGLQGFDISIDDLFFNN
jgi:hypothetical protein